MWMLIAVGVLIVILGLVYAISKDKRPTDYYNLFIIGITWVGAGLAIGIVPLWGVGLVFIAIGLANKSKWKENRRKWKDLKKDQRFWVILITVLLGLLALIGIVAFLLIR
jgi:hypothetical protein